MKRRTWLVVAAAVAAALVIGGVVAMSSADEATPSGEAPPATTAKVDQGPLSAMVSLAGTLTHRARSDGSPYSAINQRRGIYTELPAVGDKVGCGDVLYRVDDIPVLLLCGAVPAYRDLNLGDQGSDVRQLNRDLGIEADDDFTWRTEAALERLQHARGLDATGALDLGAAIFLPEPVRIARVTGELGGPARPGAEFARATSETLEVQVALDASQQGQVERGDRAQITLPGNVVAKGKLERLGRIARTAGKDDGAAATIPAFIGLADPRKARGLDSAPVRVEITTRGVENALSVPLTALVGKAGGGYAVEAVRGGGRRELVAVKLGLFDTAGGRVQIEGDLDVGDRVVVPSL